MSDRFRGRTVMITGGGTGIGRATALRFANEGADVMIIGRRLVPLEDTIRAIRALGGSGWEFCADVSDAGEVDGAVAAALSRWPGIDVFVNNAGTANEAPFLEISNVGWDRVLATNLRGAFLGCRAVARAMVTRGRGCTFVHVASVAGLAAEGPYASYGTSKAALFALSRAIACELARHGIRSNVVSPGFVDTGFDSWPPTVERHLRDAFDRVPMRRQMTPEEIAAAILFLASDDASGITGTNLIVDGGMMATLYGVDSLPFGAD